MNKEKLMKKARKVANYVALVSLIFNASMFGVFAPEVAKAASSGFLEPTNNSTGSGGSSWSNPDRGYTSNDSYATAGNSGRWVSYSNFSIPSIPNGATIDGIELSIEGNTTGRDVNASLSWNHNNYTPNVAAGFTSGTDEVKTVGGPTSKWGRTWVANDLINANFRARVTTTSGGGSFALDQVMVKVYYTLNSAPSPAPVSQTPADNTLTKDPHALNFSWIGSTDPDGDAVNYDFQVSTSSTDFTTPARIIDLGTSATNLTIPSATSVPDGTYYWRVSAYDLYGNQSAWSSVRSFTVDTVAPTLTDVSISSDNANSALAKVGNTVTVSFTADENIVVPVDAVTIDGQDAIVSGSGSSYTATYTMADTDTEGLVPFTISGYSDLAGNVGAPVSYSPSQVIFDKTAPVGVTSATVDATNPTNNNNPTVYGDFDLGLNQEVLPTNVNPNDYDIAKIDVTFDNGTNKYTKTLDGTNGLDYFTGQFTTEGVSGFQMAVVDPSDVLPDGTYQVTAVSYDWAGNPSTPFIAEPALVIDTTAPADVTNLKVTGKTDTTVSLSWDAVSDASGYKVYYGTEGGVWTGSRDAGNVTNFTMTGLTANTNYNFKVVAYDVAMNDSTSSNIVNDTTSATPVVEGSRTTASLASATGAGTSGNSGALGATTAPAGQVESATDTQDQDQSADQSKKEEEKPDNNNGSSAFWWLLLLAIVAGGGYYYYMNHPDMFSKRSNLS